MNYMSNVTQWLLSVSAWYEMEIMVTVSSRRSMFLLWSRALSHRILALMWCLQLYPYYYVIISPLWSSVRMDTLTIKILADSGKREEDPRWRQRITVRSAARTQLYYYRLSGRIDSLAWFRRSHLFFSFCIWDWRPSFFIANSGLSLLHAQYFRQYGAASIIRQMMVWLWSLKWSFESIILQYHCSMNTPTEDS